MKSNSKSGATLAAAAATLFLAGSVVTTGVDAGKRCLGKCMAGNACKGQSACKGSANSCKGRQRVARARVFRRLPKSSAPPWAPSSSRVDLPHPIKRGLGVAGPSLFRPDGKDPRPK